MVLEGFALGLASGPACVVTCTPVLGPWLVAERGGPAAPWRPLAEFLIGRLIAYGLFAVAAWWLARALSEETIFRAWIFGLANTALGVVLIPYGLRRTPDRAAGHCGHHRDGRLGARLAQTIPTRMPLLLGFFLGLNLCPPFLLATTAAAQTESLGGSLLFFFLFFLGTSLWLLPFPLFGALGRVPSLAVIARFSAAIVGLYYAYLGILTLGGILSHG